MQEIQVRPLIWEATRAGSMPADLMQTRRAMKPLVWVVQEVKNLPAKGRPVFDPWVRKIPWRKA